MRGIPSSAIKFGIFAIVTAVLTGLLITVIGSISFVPTHTFTAVFTDATQVQPGDEVRLAGVKVGSVKSLHLDDRKYAAVSFSVQQSVPVFSSAHIAIQYQNLLGQRYLAIQEQPGGHQITSGKFSTAQTEPALNLTDLFNGFRPLFQALDPNQVNKLSFEIIQTLQGQSGTLQQLMANTAQLTTTIANKDAVVGQVIDNLDAVLATVNDRDTKLTSLIGNFRDLMVGLAKNRSTITSSIPNLAALLTATSGLLSQARQPLAADITNLGKLSSGLNSTKSTLDAELHYLPKKLSILTRTASYGSWFNFYLCGADLHLTLLGTTIDLATPVDVQANERDTVCGKGPQQGAAK